MKCNNCNKKAVYKRCTQFTGDHAFCKECAMKEKDFKKYDSYFFWQKI